ncbi:MAG TPA: hypothetical protein VLM89_01060 [Phycisphaerae bacterium]|nr:hypothetical protein [Phycisphaerae bacterium]
MTSRIIIAVTGTIVVCGLALGPVWATDAGADTTMSAIQADVTADGIINFTANRIILGNTNTLSFAASGGAADALNELAVSAGADAVLDATEDVTITKLTPLGNLNIRIATDKTATITRTR